MTLSRKFWTESSPVEGQSLLQQKDKKRRKREAPKKIKRKNEKLRDVAPGVNVLNIQINLS